MKNLLDKEMSFGETISFLRKSNGFTKKEVAEYVDCSQTYIADIEKRKKIPSDNIIIKLAELFKYKKKTLLFLAKREATVPEARELFRIQKELYERELICDYFLTVLTFVPVGSDKGEIPLINGEKKIEFAKMIWDEIDLNYIDLIKKPHLVAATDDIKYSDILKFIKKSDEEIIDLIKQLINKIEYNIDSGDIKVTFRSSITDQMRNVEPASMGTLIDIPLLTWVQAGDMTDYEDTYPYPGCSDEYISTDLRGDHLFALRVKGDSMTPKFLEGDIVIVNPDAQTVNGDYVVVKDIVGQETTLKQLKTYSNNVMVMHPLNPIYPDVELDENCVIIGRVVRKQTNM